VRDPAVVKQLTADLGKRVLLDYDQHKWLPSCLGETEYFITAVQVTE
jgi:hypothetical protein